MIPKRVIKIAITAAWKGNVIRGKMGAVAFNSSGHVVASAHNKRINGNERITLHAEESLLAKLTKLRAVDRLGRLDMVVRVRIQASKQKLYMAKPCPRCAAILAQTGLRVFYSDRDGQIKRLKS